jgi:hypothetical protein
VEWNEHLRFRHPITLLLLLLLLSACARQNEIELTLAAQNATLRSQMTGVFGTAAIESDRLLITLDYMGTRVAQVDQQNLNLQATLIARGTSPGAIGPIDPNNVTLIPTSEASIAQPGATPLPQADIVVTPGASVVVTSESTEPALSNIVLSSGVGNDDCATSSSTSFTSADAEIYVVANAYNIVPGTTIGSRWQIGGQEIFHDFTPDFEINGNCIWFFIDQTDAPFVAGNWNVQLEINGSPVGSPLQFSITG